MQKKVALIILDGYGIAENSAANAIERANKSYIDSLFKNYPSTVLKASGEAVGLPSGQMGNSEVGHLNIGAGRIVYQTLSKINNSIKMGEFNKNSILNKAIDNVLKSDSNLHIFGLLSDGGVHSHIKHIEAILQVAKDKKIQNIFLHAFLDGRDVPPKSALKYITQIEKSLKGIGSIATVSGRYYAMDRDNNLDRTKKATDAIVKNIGEKFDSATSGIESYYAQNISDEFIPPFIVTNNSCVKRNDSIIFVNFRPDRAIQISKQFSNSKFSDFATKNFYCMAKYSDDVIGEVLFPPEKLHNTLGEVLAANKLHQLRIAETEKYAHVTFFLDGGCDSALPFSKRILVDSPKVATYDLKPEMSAYEVTDATTNHIKNNKCDMVILNYANLDMVGHTTGINATIKAVEVIDECLKNLLPSLIEAGYTCLITSDHGNAEQMLDENRNPFSAHTSNKVPFLIIDKGIKIKSDGILADIAPTILDIMNIKKPSEMTGKSLI